MIYKTLAGAKAMVDLGCDSSYFHFVYVVARNRQFETCWSDENQYIPKVGKLLWTGRREIGVNAEGAWIRLIHWTRVDGKVAVYWFERAAEKGVAETEGAGWERSRFRDFRTGRRNLGTCKKAAWGDLLAP